MNLLAVTFELIPPNHRFDLLQYYSFSMGNFYAILFIILSLKNGAKYLVSVLSAQEVQ